jgi:hypothetical protein
MSSLRGLNKYIIEQMNYNVLSFPNLSIYPNKTFNELNKKKKEYFAWNIKKFMVYLLLKRKLKILIHENFTPTILV